jgi:protein dithiol oxidoreductase (disulfide-forming)
MNRREFSVLSGVAAACVAGVSPLAQAQGKKPEDGAEYISLDKPVATDAAAGQVEVIEFFWYSCPHCNAFEPKLEAWIKAQPKSVLIRRVPVAFRDSFVPQQRLFYALEAMGKVKDLHAKVFYAIHVEKQSLDRLETIGAWVAKQGVDKAKFEEHYNSFSVQTKARKATQLQDAFKVSGVPALGIAGRYYTDGTLAGTMERALWVTDYLVAQSRGGK